MTSITNYFTGFSIVGTSQCMVSGRRIFSADLGLAVPWLDREVAGHSVGCGASKAMEKSS